MKSKFYRVFAIIFALLGLTVFGIVYSVENPSFLIVLVFPFLPAIVLTWKSGKMEDKAIKALSDSE